MPSQHRKHRGYQTQKIVADRLKDHGWAYAESAGAGRTGSDITGVPGLDIEVKARRNLDLTGALAQQAKRATPGALPIVIVRPDGYGPARIDDWPAVVTLATLLRLLDEAGYTPQAPA